ncbi:von Willebrand factor A domain-containing protein 3A [Elysia marginata]|uniref:von Willebrand factor A domain-containing protein 3A n=1 Tax=Elysia marginata TaxID=1093978 RepID=A0AAV4GMB0_9GAST|nr:von Willebrand factor A domain-containing protein 3A [Elysia marginata]
MSQLFEYQKQLSDAVVLYERRVDWLASGSRRIFGAVTEKNVVILIDTSVSNVKYLVHLQHSLRLLMEEQIANKDYFNLIAFGSKSRQWMPTMMRPTPENLQKAWKWVLDLQCGGSRNFLAAYRMAVENDEEIKHHIFVQGCYLFTSGVPDQAPEVVMGYIQEASSGRGVRLHTVLFNVDDYDCNGAIPGRYANITRTAECLRNMAHVTAGRFQWFRETGIIENDDIQYINSEIDKALNFSRKCAVLVESVKKKYRNRFGTFEKKHTANAGKDFLGYNVTFLDNIVTGDETWLHHCTPETKQDSMTWKHPSSPVAKKFKVMRSVKKIMGTVCWDSRGVLLFETLQPGETINAARYCQTLDKLREAIRRKRPGQLTNAVILQHNNATPHTARVMQGWLEKYGWEIVSHPPHSPDLAPSDYHLFGPLKHELAGKRFDDNEELVDHVRKWLQNLDGSFFREGIYSMLHHPEMHAITSSSSSRRLKGLPEPEEPVPFTALPPPAPQAASTVTSRYQAYGSSSRVQTTSLLERSRPPKAISWRPSSASSNASSKDGRPGHKPLNLRQRPSSARDPMSRARSSRNQVSTQHFFLENKKHDTGSVYSKYAGQKTIRKQIPNLSIPEQEEPITTKEWLRIYSLAKLKLDLNKMVSGPDCKHEEKPVKILQKNITAKVYPDVFPTVNVKGTLKYMQLLPHELRDYEVQLEKVLRRYLKRLQWLLSGSRRVFGTIVHKQVAILVDTSGSMEPRMDELKKEMAALVWDQLHKQGSKFNLIRFSGTCSVWRDTVQPPTESNCHDAIGWVSHLVAGGNTCTLEALQLAFRDPDIDAIYLLTDGKPDTSTSLVLREVAKMNERRNISVNTISFNCTDSTANNFLRLLSTETGGRYHRIHDDFDAQLFVHKLLSEGFDDSEYPHLPTFEGDDLRKLGVEISQARKFLQQARVYKALYKAKAAQAAERPASAKGPAPFVVGRPRPVSATKS